MKRLIIILVLGLVFANSLAAKPLLKLGREANRKEFTIVKGQMIKILLSSNPTTGYDWHLDKLNLRYFRFVNSGFIRPSGKLVGAPGQKWFEIKAVRAGNGGVRLLYYRSWEGKKKAAEEYKVNFKINP